jgi:muconate cycloisomerase
MALLDWAGKRLGCRAVDLLGGAYREAFPVDFWCSRQTPRDLARLVTQARERGFGGLKMKSTLGDPVIEQVRAVKDAGGADFGLTIDPMSQWLSPHDALALFRALEPYAQNLRVEDPFPQDRPEYWQRVRQVSPVPLVWHARDLDSLRRALADRAADAFNCTGWVSEFLVLAHAVEVAGHSCWHGSGIELGVAQAARMHAAAAARACVLSCDFVSGLIRQHTLITWDWPYQNGLLPLPAGPGLGVELDADAVRHYRQAEAEFGPA